MSLETRVTELAQAVGADIKDLQARGAAPVKVAKFAIVGTLPAMTMHPSARWYPEEAVTVLGVYFSLGSVAPGNCVAGVTKNDTNFLSASVLATAGAYKSNRVVPPAPNLVTTDYLKIDFWSVLGGGGDVTLCVEYQKT